MIEPGDVPREGDPNPVLKELAAPLSHAEDDERCVREVLAGKQERFGDLVRRHQGMVFSVVLAQIRDAHLAEDISQEVFVSAYRSLSQLRDTGRFLPWLLQIARRQASREAQKVAARPDQVLATNVDAAAPEESKDPQRVAGILSLVEQLPEPYREAVLLKYQAGLSCKEIALRERVPIGTITSRLTRALAVLRSALEEQKLKP